MLLPHRDSVAKPSIPGAGKPNGYFPLVGTVVELNLFQANVRDVLISKQVGNILLRCLNRFPSFWWPGLMPGR